MLTGKKKKKTSNKKKIRRKKCFVIYNTVPSETIQIKIKKDV